MPLGHKAGLPLSKKFANATAPHINVRQLISLLIRLFGSYTFYDCKIFRIIVQYSFKEGYCCFQ